MTSLEDTNHLMTHMTCLVTGANSGIGKETARGLAARGARVILHGRREAALQQARDDVAADAGNDDLEIVQADFASLDAVRAMAEDVHALTDELDVLVNNAGAVLSDREITEDGHEKQFQVNHLAPFLLTHELLDLLHASGEAGEGPARIVTVASDAHWNVRSVPEEFQSLEGRYRSFPIYSQTKFYNILFTRELARRLEPEQGTANCLHPGVVGSSFGSEGPWYVRGFMKIARPLLTSPEQAARTPVYLAADSEVADETGRYFKECEPAATSKLARDPELARQLWAISEELTGADGWPPAPEAPDPA